MDNQENKTKLSLGNQSNKYFKTVNELVLQNDLNIYSFKSKLPFPGNTESSDSQIWTVINVGLTGDILKAPIHDTYYDNCLVWDLFNSNYIYINSNVNSKISSANDVIPLVYYMHVLNGNSLADFKVEHGESVTVSIPSGDSIIFERYKKDEIDGWATYYEHGLNIYKPIQLELDFLDTSDIKKAMVNKLTKKISATDKITSDQVQKLIKKLNLSDNDFKMKSDTNAASINIGDSMNNSCPSCVHFTYKSGSDDISFLSKDYDYANIPSSIPICSNPKLANSNGITYCSYFSTGQSSCHYYDPNQTFIKKYVTTGSNSISFNVVQELDQQGIKKISIYNIATNELSYCLYPPKEATDDQIIEEVDSIVKEALSSWPSEVFETLSVINPVQTASKQEERKKFILSLV